MPLNKEDLSFKTLINKEFTTPSRFFFQESTVSTLDTNDTEVYSEAISPTPATAVSDGVARVLTDFILTPDPSFPTTVWYVISGSGFTPGVDTLPSFASNPSLYQRNFISDKYGASYEVVLKDNAGNQIFKTDGINWIFEYKTGILAIADPGGKATPYKVTVYQYTGRTLADNRTLGYTGSFSGSFQGNGAGLTNVPASGIVGLNLTQIADSEVSASVSATGTPFSITSASVDLLTVDSQGLVTANNFTGSFEGIGSGSFSGSFQGNGDGLTDIPASSIVGLNLSQIATGSVIAATAPDGTVFQITSGSSTLLSLNSVGDLTVSASEFIGNNLTAVGNAVITGSLTTKGSILAEQNLTVEGSTTFLNDIALTGSLEISQNLVVQGTASINYLQSVTGSAKVIGDAFIILSADVPTSRYAGIKVIDSGSTQATGSLEYDSELDHWFYQSTAEGYASGFMAGPRATRDNITWPSRYAVTRGDGGNHIVNSNIYSTGSYVTINKAGTGSLEAEVDILGSVIITGSTLLPSPDGAVSNKYALVTSQSTWHYSDNVGYPVGTNQWGSGLNGSYFNIFTPNTDTATILRFLAGLLSSSAPAPTPNTRTYDTVTGAENSLGSTATVSVLSDQRLSLGYTSSAQISQAFKDTINYGIIKGWSATGSDNNGEGTQPWKQAGAAYYQNFSTYNFRFTSNASSGTGGNGSDFFDLSTLDPAKDLKVRLIGSMSFSDTASVTAPNVSTGLVTQTKTLDFSRSVGATTALDGNGLGLATIYTANPAVIPNTYQDARFSEVGKTAFLTRSFGTSLVADNTVSSSGYYRFYGMQAGVTSGSSTSYILKTTSDITRLWLPVSAIQTSMSATPASITGGTFASSSLTIAPSRSYSGVPYLTAGTSTWTYLGTGSGMFDPAFLNGVVFRQSISETLPGTVTIAGSSNSDVSCDTSGIATSGKVYDAAGNVKNSGLPRINDEVRSNVVITHSISSGDSNISDTGLSTGTTFTGTTLGFTYTGSTGANLNTSTFPYHEAGTYGQPAASGSLGIYGGGTSNSALAEYFTSESRRRVISTSTSLTTQWSETTALTLGNHGDLQVKPSTTNGYLVNPESTKGYWYPKTGYNASDYKWYMRQFTYSGATGTITITLNPNNVSSLTTFDTTTSNSYAIGLIFEYQVNNRGGGNVVLFDVRKGNAAYNSGTQTTGQFNPFSDSIEVQGNFTAASTTGGVISLTLNGGINQVVDTGALNVWMVVRCIGTPSNTLRQITLS